MGLYINTSDTNLLRDIMLQSGKLYLYKHEFIGKGTTGTVGATCVITLTSPDTFVDDAYNGMTLLLKDDNGVLCSVNIDDSVADTSVTADTTAALLVSDETTAGTFTDATEYNMYIKGNKRFLGYSDQQVDYEEEKISFFTGDIARKKVRTDTLGIVAGFSGNVRNFGAELFGEIFGMQNYGSQTNQIQKHGGFQPISRDFYTASLEMKNVEDKDNFVEFFKGQLFPNGAVNTSEEAYKIAPYIFESVEDSIRDNDNVNMWRIIQNT